MSPSPEALAALLDRQQRLRRRILLPVLGIGAALTLFGLLFALGQLTVPGPADMSVMEARAPAGYVVLAAVLPALLCGGIGLGIYRSARRGLLERWALEFDVDHASIEELERLVE